MMAKSDLVDIVVVIRKETELAVLVLPMDKMTAFTTWLPKSRIEISRDDPEEGRHTITGERWFFRNKELI